MTMLDMVARFWEWWHSLSPGAMVGITLGIIAYIALIIHLGGDGQRYYKQVDGKLYVKHGRLGEWQEIGQHMKDKHNETDNESSTIS